MGLFVKAGANDVGGLFVAQEAYTSACGVGVVQWFPR